MYGVGNIVSCLEYFNCSTFDAEIMTCTCMVVKTNIWGDPKYMVESPHTWCEAHVHGPASFDGGPGSGGRAGILDQVFWNAIQVSSISENPHNGLSTHSSLRGITTLSARPLKSL